MNKRDEERRDQPAELTPEEPKEKKTYEKPAFRFERVFETSALSCGKVHATQSGCFRNRKLS
jgi:hypothetical protein